MIIFPFVTPAFGHRAVLHGRRHPGTCVQNASIQYYDSLFFNSLVWTQIYAIIRSISNGICVQSAGILYADNISSITLIWTQK